MVREEFNVIKMTDNMISSIKTIVEFCRLELETMVNKERIEPVITYMLDNIAFSWCRDHNEMGINAINEKEVALLSVSPDLTIKYLKEWLTHYIMN